MANYNKNIFVGVGQFCAPFLTYPQYLSLDCLPILAGDFDCKGGSEAINFSHFIGAVYGMEKMMGMFWSTHVSA